MDTTHAVTVRGLTKRYPGRKGAPETVAVRSLDLEVRRGEVLALLGPNGAGKSTTIEILTGFRDRTFGEVEVLGVDPARPTRQWRARLGLVPQATGESGTATAREAVTHAAALFPRALDVDEVIAAVGLTEHAGKRVSRLSGGQQRRVDVALSIIGDPELLFLDEPTTGFDPAARRQFWELIRALRDNGTTIVLTTHYLDEAAALGDRAGVIARGELLDLGPIDEIGSAEARIPIVHWRDSNGRLQEQRTAEPGALVRSLAAHGEPEDLQVIRPTLEDVYLDLVGESDAASAPEPEEGSAHRESTTAPDGEADDAPDLAPATAASEGARS